MLQDIGASKFQESKDSNPYFYYIKEDCLYRSTDILEATNHDCQMISNDRLTRIIEMYKIYELFKYYPLNEFLKKYKNMKENLSSIKITDKIFKEIEDYLSITELEELYNGLSQNFEELCQIDYIIRRSDDQLDALLNDRSITISKLIDFSKNSKFETKIQIYQYYRYSSIGANIKSIKINHYFYLPNYIRSRLYNQPRFKSISKLLNFNWVSAKESKKDLIDTLKSNTQVNIPLSLVHTVLSLLQE